MSKTVLLSSPALTCSGYGTHARQIARWLFDNAEKYSLDISAQLLNWGQTPWITDVSAHDGLIGELIQASGNSKPFYDVTIQLRLPSEWEPMAGLYNIGVTAGIETDICNPQWIDCVNKMNLVIVPSEFTKKCFIETALQTGKKLMTDIVVIPESFPDSILEEKLPELSLPVETDFNFLVFGQITGTNPENDRKNLFYTLKWLSETFSSNPDVGIIFKTNAGRLTKLDRAIVKNLFQRLLVETGATASGAKFYLLHGDMSEQEVASLYRHPKVKALVSFSRGEGFGLPILEAAASGLPVIATDWSAPTEFLNLGKFIKIEANIEPIHESRVDQLFMKGSKWANVKETDAKLRLTKFYMNSQNPKLWAADLKEKIQKKYSHEAISKNYYDIVVGKIFQS